MSGAIIRAVGLTKRYAGHTAVDGIDLTVNEGEVFGILGPNGAGKTTTILMLLGLTDVTSGTVEVVGLDPTRDPLGVKRVVGYMPDSLGFYDHLTARENLAYSGRLAGIPEDVLDDRIDAALARVRLDDVADRPAGAFSRGMRQRLGLAEILLKKPRVAILDEPTNGLDPQSAREFLGLIRDLKREGMTIVLSSHLLDRVQAICDRVALFSGGRIALEGDIAGLAEQVLGGRVSVELETVGCPAEALRHVDGVRHVRHREDRWFVVEADRDVRAELARAVVDAGAQLFALTVREQSLDEIYNTYFEETNDAAHDDTKRAA